MLNPRRVMTRAQILDHVWDYDFGGDGRVLETYISYLRKKLDAHGPPLIRTVRGVGYALQAPAQLMASLRSRLIASVLLLSAAGLIVLAAVTYAEQRSFLYGRARPGSPRRRPPLSVALDSALASSGEGTGAGTGAPPGAERPVGGGRPGRAGPGAGTASTCPRAPTASAGCLRQGARPRASSRTARSAPAAPALPAQVPIGQVFTVGSVGSARPALPRLRQPGPRGQRRHGRGRAAAARSTRRSTACCSSRGS